MQTVVAPALKNDARALAAADIMRKCVHCGFCLATCPTYQLLGDELDSPRGRIYQIKQIVEGSQPATAKTRQHLDRCLTCRNCETTCPSGVEYGHLIDHGRALVEEQLTRSWRERIMRAAILNSLPFRGRMGLLMGIAQRLRPLIPGALRGSMPPVQVPGEWPTAQQIAAGSTQAVRRMLVLEGCVQPSMTPATNAAAARVLGSLGIELQRVREDGCCGAIHFHLNDQERARQQMRRNIDAWWPAIEAGAEAIVVSASGCGVMVKDYAHVLSDDPDYATKARRVSDLAADVVEVLGREDLTAYRGTARGFGKVAFHPPCTLQHGQKLPQVTESLLRMLGFELLPVNDSHLCCGSAGTYSIFQPELSQQLRENKRAALLAPAPDVIATANIGCQLHLGDAEGPPIVHWVELVDRLISGQVGS